MKQDYTRITQYRADGSVWAMYYYLHGSRQ